MFQILLLSMSGILLTSCASYLGRKNCDTQNWYQVGLQAGMQGERLSENALIQQCRQVGATMSELQLDSGWRAGMSRYCQPESALQSGKSGDLYHVELCENGQIELLKKKHTEGLGLYCLNGTAAGNSGKKYKNICPAQTEKTFLPDYQLARKKYLDGKITKLETQLTDLSAELEKLAQEEKKNNIRRSSLPSSRIGDKDPYEEERRRLSNINWGLTTKIATKKDLKLQLENDLNEHLKEKNSLNSTPPKD